MAPERGGERNRGEGIALGAELRAFVRALRRRSVAERTAAFGENPLAQQRGARWLKVTQADQELQDVRNLVSLQGGVLNTRFLSSRQHGWGVIPEDRRKLGRAVGQFVVRTQLRPDVAAAAPHGMAGHALGLERAPTPFGVARRALLARRLRPRSDVGDEIVHLVALKLRPRQPTENMGIAAQLVERPDGRVLRAKISQKKPDGSAIHNTA